MQNKYLLAFPLMSMIGMIIVTIIFFIPLAGTGILSSMSSSGDNGGGFNILFLIVLFIYYFVAYTVTIFSNTALVGVALKITKGEQASVQDGINIALSRLGNIFIYAFISATVGMLARSIRESGRNSNNIVLSIIAAIIGGLIQGAWNLVVFFAVPIMVVENQGVLETLRRSWELFKRTWGESFTGNAVIGGVSCLVNLAILLVGGLLIAGAVASGSTALIVVAVALVVLAFVAVGLISGAVNGIFQASLYHFATTGDAGVYIDTELARQAFLA
jgi:membrane-anchored glycerophosphoryl diester phosphodiesterase (GDPDase)